ncbi:hypothetical protein ACQEVB_15740 [Pseudonocardia sp. CA-107938]
MTSAISATAFCALFPLLVLLAPLLLDAFERRLLGDRGGSRPARS